MYSKHAHPPHALHSTSKTAPRYRLFIGLLILLTAFSIQTKAQTASLDFVWNAPACIGEPVQFWAIPTPPSSLSVYYWNFGDGSYGSGQFIEHTYSSTGSYTVVVSMIDSFAGTSLTATHTVDIVTLCDSLYGMEGKVFYDENDNGIEDPSEIGYPSMMLRADPGPFYAITEADGSYSMKLPAGSYTVVANPLSVPWLHTSAPSGGSHSISFSGPIATSGGYDFGLAPDTSYVDLAVYLSGWWNFVVPGLTSSFHMTACNQGPNIVSGDLGLNLPSGVSYSSSSPLASSVSSGSVLWSFSNLFPGNCELYSVSVSADSTLVVGDSLVLTAFGNVPGDVDLSDNADTSHIPVLASYDPNDKRVSPAGEGPDNRIDASTEWLTYTIRFQNLGTAPAVDIRIKDTLDVSMLDVASFQALGGTHDYALDIRGNAVVTWTFDNIFLPQADVDEAASQGAVAFRIKRKEGLPIGAQIDNTVEIYFDYNEAVVTNTAFVTLWADTSGGTGIHPGVQSMEVQLYPNPGQDQIWMAFELDAAQPIQLSAYDQTGRLVFAQDMGVLSQGKQQIALPASQWPSGVFHLVLETPQSSYTGTWVKP